MIQERFLNVLILHIERDVTNRLEPKTIIDTFLATNKK